VITSDSDVEHPADSFQGLPDVHATEAPDSKVQSVPGVGDTSVTVVTSNNVVVNTPTWRRRRRWRFQERATPEEEGFDTIHFCF